MLVLEFARGEYIARRETVVLLGPSGVGKTHIALALGLAACQKGLGVRFTTASHLVHELIEARDEKRLLRLQAQLARVSLPIVDELGYVPLSQTGSELLFDVFSQRYENGATIVTSKPALPGMDLCLRQRAPHRCPARPHHPLRPHPGDERRELPAQAEPLPTPAFLPSNRTSPLDPVGPQAPSRAWADASRAQRASPRARVPPVGFYAATEVKVRCELTS